MTIRFKFLFLVSGHDDEKLFHNNNTSQYFLLEPAPYRTCSGTGLQNLSLSIIIRHAYPKGHNLVRLKDSI